MFGAKIYRAFDFSLSTLLTIGFSFSDKFNFATFPFDRKFFVLLMKSVSKGSGPNNSK